MPSARAGTWGDLGPRILTGIALLLTGGGALWAGGWWFAALIALAAGAMIWELVRMLCGPAAGRLALALGAGAALVMLLAAPGAGLGAIAPALGGGALLLAGGALISCRRGSWFLYAPLILLGGFSLLKIRADLGLSWLIWLIAVVVMTDIAGYFVGRLLGGPKFWPAISPKKTWSGTLGGWLGAALIGWLMASRLDLSPAFAIIGSVLVSFVSQLGDIAESAIKRSIPVKDSSSLLPGHGGVLDRFDGMIAAATAALALVWWLGRVYGVS